MIKSFSVLDWAKLILAVALLLCMGAMPYGICVMVRFVAMIVFGCMAWNYFTENKLMLLVVSGALALLYQPFIRIGIDPDIWLVLNLVSAAFLIITIFRLKDKG